MLDDNMATTLADQLEDVLRASTHNGERQALAIQILEDSSLHNSLLEQASDNSNRAQQLKAKNWLMWLQQEARR